MKEIDDLRKKGGQFVDAADKLEVAMQENDPQKFAAQLYNIMRDHDSSAVGVVACKVALARGDEGKAIVCELGKQVMKAELQNPKLDVSGFLRGDHAINGMTKEYLQQTSPELEQQMKQAGEKARSEVDMALAKEKGPLSPEYDRVGTELTNKYIDELSKMQLSDESKQYLKGMNDELMSDSYQNVLDQRNQGRQVVITKEKLRDDYVANATVLRLGMPPMVTGAPERIAIDASGTAQTIANKTATDDVSGLNIKAGNNANMVRNTFNDGRRQMIDLVTKNVGNKNAPSMGVDLKSMGEGLKDELANKVQQLRAEKGPQVTAPTTQTQVNVPTQTQVNVPNQTQTQTTVQPQQAQTKHHSVRDFLKAAKETIKEKLGLDDESKLKRAQKQLQKREDHLDDLKKAKVNVDNLLSKEPHVSALKQTYDPQKALNGEVGQIQIAKSIELKAIGDNLDKRILNNEGKVQRQEDRVQHLEDKIKLKANQHNQQQNQHHGHGV